MKERMQKQQSKDWLLKCLVSNHDRLGFEATKTENQMRMNWFVSWLFRWWFDQMMQKLPKSASQIFAQNNTQGESCRTPQQPFAHKFWLMRWNIMKDQRLASTLSWYLYSRNRCCLPKRQLATAQTHEYKYEQYPKPDYFLERQICAQTTGHECSTWSRPTDPSSSNNYRNQHHHDAMRENSNRPPKPTNLSEI